MFIKKIFPLNRRNIVENHLDSTSEIEYVLKFFCCFQYQMSKYWILDVEVAGFNLIVNSAMYTMRIYR